MTKEEFDNYEWYAGVTAVYNLDACEYLVSSVNFKERLIQLKQGEGDYIWVRCENVEIVND